MNHLHLLAALLLTAIPSSVAFAQQEPAPAPDTLIMLGSDIYANGSSSNISSALRQYIDSYYVLGACQESDGWTKCDDIRFGLELYAGRECADTGPDGPVAWIYAPDEDAGALVKNRLNNVQTERGSTFCGGGGYNGENCMDDDDCQGTCNSATDKCVNSGTVDLINHDSALTATWDNIFPGTTAATEAQLDQYWERPHLNFMVLESFPQSIDGSDDGRLLRTLAQACAMLDGGLEYDGTACSSDAECTAGTCECPMLEPNCTTGKQCALPAGLPSNPTWVMTERQNSTAEAVFGGLVAAAGGTGSCEERISNGSWTEFDVCEAITIPEVTSAGIKTAINDGDIRCGAGAKHAQVGALDFGASTGTLSEIQCHMFGEIANNVCSGDVAETDLIGIFQCIRQLPRGVTADDAVIRFCRNGIDDDGTPIDDDCIVLRESEGEIEFIDDKRTLFIIVSGPGKPGDACTTSEDCKGLCVNGTCDNSNKCDGGSVEVFECPYGPCDTGLPGRCAAGQIACPDGQLLCIPESGAYPEICNGLDDDCDGSVDNMKESWADDGIGAAYSLPDDHQGLHCNKLNVCACPDGATDTHSGTDWDSFLDGWSGVCECGEGLAPDTFTPSPETEASDQATCAAVGSSDGVPAMFLALLAIGFAPLVRRRKS